MKLLLANPNATKAITEACAELAVKAASVGTEIVPWTNGEGPAVVNGYVTDTLAARALLSRLPGLATEHHAVALAGFGSYGTAALKEALSIPVVNMAEAAMSLALPLCHRFAIVTTAARMIPYTEDLVQATGFASRCAAIRAVSLPPVSQDPIGPASTVDDLADQVRQITTETSADLVILGGARLSPFAAALASRTRVPVIEPVAAAVHVAEALVRLRLSQSKLRKFAPADR